MFIFLDESGDLGFDFTKPKTSHFFVITLLVCHDKLAQDGFRRAVERTIKNKLNHKKNKNRIVQELKGAHTALVIKQYFRRQLPADGWSVYSVTLNKCRVDPHLKTKAGKQKLYNFLARFILEKVHFPEDTSRVGLVVDRCKNREEIRDFTSMSPTNCKRCCLSTPGWTSTTWARTKAPACKQWICSAGDSRARMKRKIVAGTIFTGIRSGSKRSTYPRN